MQIVFERKTIFDKIYSIKSVSGKRLAPKALEYLRTVCIPHNPFSLFCKFCLNLGNRWI
jgi:hypothetical protein